MKTQADDAQPQSAETFNTADFSADSLQRIDDSCVRFERAWKSGDVPVLENYLTDVDASLRSALLNELLLLDIEYRTRDGQTPNPSDYETRFPGETRVIESAFKSTGDESRKFFDSQNLDQVPPFSELSLTSQFHLRQFHAQGGLGVIYIAHDETLGRDVAVKFCRNRVKDSVEQKRLAREAQITGRLAHPGIVSVHASGVSESGLPCYIMPLIDGQTLHKAIRDFHDGVKDKPERNPFATFGFRQLLQRFVAVCNTVAYAHEQRVIHRDIKPSNIMLGRFGETYLLDWGLAKSLASEVNESDGIATSPDDSDPLGKPHEPGQTLPGQQVGTPAFASPEQVAGDVEQHDVRSDIYSLGATLYCLLVGKGPIKSSDLTSRKSASVLRDVPAPRLLNRAVPANLEAICLTAMAFEASARYKSAQCLAEDVERFLADEPVKVFREPVSRQAGRWLRKHPRFVSVVASSILVALVSLAIGSYVLGKKNIQLSESNSGFIAAQASRSQAQLETKAALRTLTDDAIHRWMAREEELSGEDRAFIESILASYERFAHSTSDELDAIETKAEGYFRVGQLYELLDNKSATVDAWTRGLDVISEFDGIQSANLRNLQAKMQSRLGVAFADLGDRRRGLELTQTAAAISLDLMQDNPDFVEFRIEYAQRLDQLGNIHVQAGHWDSAEVQFRKSLQLTDGLVNETPKHDLRLKKLRAGTLHNLGLTLWQLGQSGKARKPLEASLQLHRQLVEDSSRIIYRVDLGRVLTTLGSVHRNLKDLVSAQASFDEAISGLAGVNTAYPSLTEPMHLMAAAHRGNAGVRYDKGNFEESLISLQAARTFIGQALDRSPDEVQFQKIMLEVVAFQGATSDRLGRLDDAASFYTESLAMAEELFQSESRPFYRERMVKLLKELGGLQFRKNKLDQAQVFVHRSLDLIEELPESPERRSLSFDEVGCHQILGWSLLKSGKLEEAAVHWNRIIDVNGEDPIVLNGENTSLSAKIHLTMCTARTNPGETLVEVKSLACEAGLDPSQIYNLAGAAGMASQFLENDDQGDKKDDAERTALELLKRSFTDKKFSSKARLDSLRGNPCFRDLFDHEEFKRIEQSIVSSLDKSE